MEISSSFELLLHNMFYINKINMCLLILNMYIIKLSYGRNCNSKLLRNIARYQKQTLYWEYPQNSKRYISKTYDQNVRIYDGRYDFIICGAGSSGSILANRLSENENWDILLLDAGTWGNNVTIIPNLAKNLRTSKYNWGYHTVSQKKFMKGYINQSILIPYGKAMGGSSVIGSMIYSRGNKDEYDEWGESNPGWSYEEILPLLKKFETASIDDNSEKIFRGTKGTLNVKFSNAFDRVGKTFLEANKELGRKVLPDYNGKYQMGFSRIQVNELDGKRLSASKAFITPIKNRANIRILTHALITKLLINKKQIYGVQYVRKKTIFYAIAMKEVILSMGAINTPQIMMLSGIGPRCDLKKLGIPVVKNLQVGKSLHDHITYNALSFRINKQYEEENIAEQLGKYLEGTGPLTTDDGLQAIGYIHLKNPKAGYPEFEYLVRAYTPPIRPYEFYKHVYGYTKRTYKRIVKPIEGKSQLIIQPIYSRSESLGEVRLKSSSPFEYPVIDPKYFSVPYDIKRMSEAIKDILQITNTTAMRELNPKLIKVHHPKCGDENYGSDNFWKCMVSCLATSAFHYSGTAKMGWKEDETSVVDSNLKVHGVEGLRVADCSVIPVKLSGHGNAVAYLIGEKASDIIKNEYD